MLPSLHTYIYEMASGIITGPGSELIPVLARSYADLVEPDNNLSDLSAGPGPQSDSTKYHAYRMASSHPNTNITAYNERNGMDACLNGFSAQVRHRILVAPDIPSAVLRDRGI